MRLSIGLMGAKGRMGCELIRQIAAHPDTLQLSAAWVRPGDKEIGADAGLWAGGDRMNVPLSTAENDRTKCEVVIDFSTSEGCLEAAAIATEQKAALLSGTTGLDRQAQEAIQQASEHVAVLHAGNFSIGSAVLEDLVRVARRRLDADFAVRILDLHHANKRDAPSGTALTLGRAAGETWPPDEHAGLSFASIRGGDVVGDHTVYFLGFGERLELTHRVQNRSIFASGALRVAPLLSRQPPRLYQLAELLRSE